MKLLHTADLHLDSPFCGATAEEAEARREAQRRLFARVFACAKEEACDLILIAGDLFDGKYVTPETADLARRLFREAGVPVLLAPGNHDPFVPGSFYGTELPENVMVFTSSELQCFALDDLHVRVFGYAFSSAALTVSPLAGADVPKKGDWLHLLCAHADLNAPLSRYAPLSPGDVARLGVDYAALGHVHCPSAEQACDKPCIRYCGIPQGRSFDEPGEGSVLLVTLTPGEQPSVERRTVSHERYRAEELDISHCASEEDVRRAAAEITAACSAIAGTHLRLTLTGFAEPEWSSGYAALAESLRGNLASLTVRDETLPAVSDRVLRQDISLRGAFYRALAPKLTEGDAESRRRAALALQIGLAAIDGRRIPERRDET